MKQIFINCLLGYCCGIMLLLAGCSIPRMITPQKDLPYAEAVVAPDGPFVFIASRKSEFKQALVDKIINELVVAGVNAKTTGIDDLAAINASDYAAVVVVSTCIAWGLDPEIVKFLDQHEDHSNIILVTTSGTGSWVPDKDNMNFDAISAASRKADIDTVAGDILELINARLKEPS